MESDAAPYFNELGLAERAEVSRAVCQPVMRRSNWIEMELDRIARRFEFLAQVRVRTFGIQSDDRVDHHPHPPDPQLAA